MLHQLHSLKDKPQNMECIHLNTKIKQKYSKNMILILVYSFVIYIIKK